MDRTPIRTKLEQVRSLIDMGFVHFDFEEILEFHYKRWIQAGDTVVDVGAHIGRHLGPLSESVGDTGLAIGFEPLPFAFSKLQERFKENNIQLHNLAISNRTGRSEFVFAEGAAEESGLLERRFNSPQTVKARLIDVNVDTLDNVLKNLESISFIKIDIEGGEIDCLLGATYIIKKYRPVISVEYGDLAYEAYGNTPDTLFNFASDNDLVIFDMFMNQIENIQEWRDCLNYVYWDFFLVPNEKVADFVKRVVAIGTKFQINTITPTVSNDLIAKAQEVEALRIELQSLQAKLGASMAEAAKHETEIRAVMNSTSWKMTAPIRRMVNTIKG